MWKNILHLGIAALLAFGCKHKPGSGGNNPAQNCQRDHCTDFIITAMGSTSGLAHDEEQLYFGLYYAAPDGAILKAPIGGGTPSTLLDGIEGPREIRLVDRTLYFWSDSVGVAQVDVDSGAQTVLDPEGQGPIIIALGRAYYNHSSSSGSWYAYQPLGGGTAQKSPWNPDSWSQHDETYLYQRWQDASPLRVTRMADAAIDATVAPNSVGTGYPLAIDANNVYCVKTEGGVIQVSKGAGSPVTLASPDVASLYDHYASDGQALFWSHYNNGFQMVLKVPVGGGTVTTLTSFPSDSGEIRDLNLTDDAIYALLSYPGWSGAGGGGVARIAPK